MMSASQVFDVTQTVSQSYGGFEKDADILKIDGVKLGQSAEQAAGTQEDNTLLYFLFFPFCFSMQQRPCNIMLFGSVSCHCPNTQQVCIVLDRRDVFISDDGSLYYLYVPTPKHFFYRLYIVICNNMLHFVKRQCVIYFFRQNSQDLTAQFSVSTKIHILYTEFAESGVISGLFCLCLFQQKTISNLILSELWLDNLKNKFIYCMKICTIPSYS